MEWVKKAQKAIGVAGDEILDGLGDSLSDGKSLKFIGNVDFYASISKEKIGHIQAVDFPKPQDFVLDLVTLIPEIVLNSSIKCKIKPKSSCSHSSLNSLLMVASHNGSIVGQSSSSELSFKATCIGDYVVSATLHGQHVSGSPITLPVTRDNLDSLAQLGLTPAAAGDGYEAQVTYEYKSTGRPLKFIQKCIGTWIIFLNLRFKIPFPLHLKKKDHHRQDYFMLNYLY